MLTELAKSEIQAACLWCRGSGFDGECAQCKAFGAVMGRRLEICSKQFLAIMRGAETPLTEAEIEHGEKLAKELGLEVGRG